MKIETITNRVATFEMILNEQLQSCVSFNIASAFIDNKAIDLIEQSLKRTSLRNARLLISVFDRFNKQADLFRLNELARKYASKFSVNISRDKRFHWKYYQFANARQQNIFIGSANFTAAGIATNGEIVVRISDNLSTKNKDLDRLSVTFDDELKNSGSISEFRIDLYKERKRDPSDSTPWPIEIEDFFNRKESREDENAIEKAVLLYRTEEASKETEKAIINYNPGWQQNNRYYFICYDKREFELCKRIRKFLIISRFMKGDYFSVWARYIGNCELKTRDGKYFIGYEFLSKERKLSNSKLMSLTDKNGFGYKLEGRVGVLGSKVLGKRQVAELEQLLSTAKKASL